MNKILHIFSTMIQISIIVFAVFITIVRLSAHSIDGFEPNVEAWFQEQGLQAEINHLTFRVDGFTPELYINGLEIIDQNNQPLITLNTATLHLDLFQSLFSQNLIIDKAEFFLQKAVIDSASLNHQSNEKDALQIPTEIAHSLLGLKHFSLMIKQLDYVDAQNKSTSIFNSKIMMFDKNEEKQLQFSSSLFQQKSKLLSGYFDIKLDRILEDSSLSGVGIVNINIPSLQQAKLPGDLNLQGDLKWQNWIEFEGLDGRMISLIKSNKTSFIAAKNKHDLVIDSVIQTSLSNDQLSLSIDNEELKINRSDLSLLKLSAHLSQISKTLNNSLMQFENIDIKELSKLAVKVPALKKQAKLIKQLKAKGTIKELFVNVIDSERWEQSQVSLMAEELQWKVQGVIPAINQFNLNVVANAQHFNAKVTSDSLSLLLGTLYTHPFKVDSLKASINGQFNDLVTLIDIPSINAKKNKATVNGRANFAFEKGASPYMFVRLEADNADFKTVEPFLPQKLMDEEVLHWVKSSVLKANVKTADVIYSGRLENDVNFGVKNNGIFIAALNLKNVDLQYDKQWPNVKAKQADVTFKNYQLNVASSLGSSLNMEATDIRFSIANLDNPKAKLSLKAKDDLKKQWQFLAKSPINEYIPYFSDISDLEGSANTSVHVSFPIEGLRAKDVLFDVNLKTQKAGFSLNSLGILLGDLNGDIRINQEGLTINPVEAKWYDQPINLSANTTEDRAIHLNIKGDEIDANSLMHVLPSLKESHVSGKSAWDINVVINQDTSLQPLVTIAAHSGLKGTSINLPMPFSLDEEDTNYLNVELEIFDDSHIEFSMNLDHRFDAFARLIKKDQQYEVQGANVMFGDQEVSETINDKINLRGDIQELNADHWISYLESENLNNGTDPLSYIESLDLSINQLIAYGIEATNTKIKMNHISDGLKGTIDSSIALGKMFIPVSQDKKVPIELDMDFIKIKIKANAANKDVADYATDLVPNIFLKSKRLSVNEKEFTDAVMIVESHQNNYFNLKALSLTHKQVSLNATGDWTYDSLEDKHTSKVSIKINGEQIGQSLSQLGMGDVIENGKVDFDGQMSWPKAFWSLDLDEAKGNVKLSLKDGYFKDVDPGSGRLVGLLSLTALPRRLTLDFSDFFKKGLEFDQIKGDFSINKGSMWTKNLKLKGSVADVKIEGRTGLKRKDYDQIITVIPQVRDALPVLGSLVSGATVGWALLLIQKIFKDPIDESVSIKYKITGDWNDPKIEVIEKPKLKDSEEEVNENN